MDKKSSQLGEINEQKKRKVTGEKNRKVKRKRRDCAATLYDCYPSTCLTWEALPGDTCIRVIEVCNPPPRKGDSTRGAKWTPNG